MTRSPAQQAQLERVNAARRSRVAERIEDLEFLIDGGVPIREAVARVGWNMGAAQRALHRHGHPLARETSRLHSRDKYVPAAERRAA